MSEPVEPTGAFSTPATGAEPPLPSAFRWSGGVLTVAKVLRSWRQTKSDRGDDYLKRHWFEIETAGGARVRVYYDRDARRGQSHWWLYTIEE